MNDVYYSVEPYTGDIICHYGTEGMKWGKRNYQYPDGRFNEAGKERYFGKNKNNNNSKKFIKTKTETELKINLPLKIGSIAHKIIKENPDKFTKEKQKDFNEAIHIWFDGNFDKKYGIDQKYTSKFDKWFNGDNSKMKKALNSKYSDLFQNEMVAHLKKHGGEDKLQKNINDVYQAISVGTLLDLGVKPTEDNIQGIRYYMNTIS